MDRDFLLQLHLKTSSFSLILILFGPTTYFNPVLDRLWSTSTVPTSVTSGRPKRKETRDRPNRCQQLTPVASQLRGGLPLENFGRIECTTEFVWKFTVCSSLEIDFCLGLSLQCKLG